MLGNQGIKNRGSPAIPWTARLPRWSEWRDLNPRPHGPEPCALPTALHPDSFCIIAGFSRPVKCRPAVRRRTPGRSNQLHRGREQRQDMRMHRLLKNRSKRISLAPVCRALKKEMRTLVGAPHGGAARLRRTSVSSQAKPWRRRNSLHSRRRLCRLTDVAYPLRVLPPSI